MYNEFVLIAVAVVVLVLIYIGFNVFIYARRKRVVRIPESSNVTIEPIPMVTEVSGNVLEIHDLLELNALVARWRGRQSASPPGDTSRGYAIAMEECIKDLMETIYTLEKRLNDRR